MKTLPLAEHVRAEAEKLYFLTAISTIRRLLVLELGRRHDLHTCYLLTCDCYMGIYNVFLRY